MKRTLITAVVLAGLSAQTAAFAQSTVSPSNEPAVPMNTVPEATKESGALTPSLNISRDWRASKLIGTKVTNMQDQSVGTIDDVVLNNDGKVVSVLVSIGGFLGLGEKRVAVAFKELLISRAEDGDPLVKVTLSKQSLETAPDVGATD
jgi:sporulation protein YlmC with PRC-barrel domain